MTTTLSYRIDLDIETTIPIERATDHQLVAATGEGDELAFQELVRRFRNPITNFVYRILNDYDRAVELAQETFLRVYVNAKRYEATFSFSTYIYRIATNLAISELRLRKRRKLISIFTPWNNSQDGEEQVLEIRDEKPLQDTDLIERERSKAISRAIHTLPEKYRTILILRDVEEISYEQIAQILGISEGTVKSRINRGRNLLRDKIKTYL